MDNNQLINSDIIKKQRSVQAQRRYRERLKAGETVGIAKYTYDIYKKQNAVYMVEYRKNKKIATIKAYADANPTEPKATTQKKIENVEKKPKIITVKPIIKSIIKRNVIPKWKTTLPESPTEADKVIARSYSIPVRDVMIKKIIFVMKNVLSLTPSKDIIRVIKTILSGYDVKGDIKYINKEMSFLREQHLIAFVNKIHSYYPKITTFYTMISPFANLLARLPTFNHSYQQLILISKKAMGEYNDDRDKNEIDKKDVGKIFSFEPKDVKYHIDTFLTNDRDKALAAVYALQPPRRLDFQFMIITENNPNVLTDKNYNYLVVSGGEPTKFVYNNYKTYNTYKQQVINVNHDIIPYLKNYIKSAKLLPINGEDKYLFGSNNNTEQTRNFGTKLKDVFYKMYGEDITSTWIRISASTWINGGSGKNKKSLAIRKKFAENMAHSRALNEQYEKIIVEI